MKNTLKIALISGLILNLLQCSGKSNMKIATPGTEIKAPTEAMSVQARVLADSGATLSIGSSLQLTVPAGALDVDTDISVTKTQAAPQQENLVPVGNAIELGAHGTEFNKSVTLNSCYDPAALAAKGLAEDTLQVYYVDPDSGNYAAVGGTVNKGSHCVTAQLQHFSTYLIAAQILQGGNNPPVVSAPTFTPSVPLAGLPLKVSSIITDYELSTVNGQVGFGQVATAQLYYRIPGEPSFTQVSLTPDYLDDTATRYSYKIPANRVTAAGIEYYLKATDNLGLNRVRNTAVLPVTRTVTSIAFSTNAVVDIAAGFKRSYTVRAIDDLAVARNIDVDSFTLNGGIGTATKTSASVIQVSATTANPQNYRTGSLTANAGPFSVTSADIRVHAGMLDHIELLSPTGVVLGSTITVNANSTYDFDIIGYDAFGNTSNVLPLFVIVPVSGAGTITPTGLYTAPATAQTATLVATLDGVMDSILINVVPAGWSNAPAMVLNRTEHKSVLLNDGRVLITGGYAPAPTDSAEIFDPSANSGFGAFVATGNMSVIRADHAVTLLANGKVLVSGGAGADVFDPAANGGIGAFFPTAAMTTYRSSGHSATLLNDGRVLIVGGDSSMGTAEIFDPAGNGGLGVFTSTGSPSLGRTWHTAVRLNNGKVLIAGGIVQIGPVTTNSMEIFDPAANGGVGAFTPTVNMSVGRGYNVAGAVLLNDGKVLITGGSFNGTGDTADVFDPALNGGMGGIFATYNMLGSRAYHTATILSSGDVIIIGGVGTGYLTATERFIPGAGFVSDLPINTGRYHNTTTLLNSGKLLVVGGTTATTPAGAEIR